MRKEDQEGHRVRIMEDIRAEQKEALEVLVEFNEKLLHNIPILVKELSGERLEDTEDFKKSIIDAINWEVQVVNGTLDFLNEGKVRVDKEAVNEKILALGKAIKEKDDKKLAEAFSNVVSVFENLGKAAKEVI